MYQLEGFLRLQGLRSGLLGKRPSDHVAVAVSTAVAKARRCRQLPCDARVAQVECAY